MDKARLDEQFPRVDEIPFSSEKKRMTTIHESPDGIVSYTKGAPEVILASCSRRMTGTDIIDLDTAEREAILETARQMAKEALRVLAIACNVNASITDAETGMTFVGLVGMIDPPRKEARHAVQMWTGGHQGADDYRRSSAYRPGRRHRIKNPQGGAVAGPRTGCNE
jgi:Ca2+-transporting ATPase